MRILLTNDDGIFARGLKALHDELSREAECLIVAPEVERSAVGHAITLFRPLMVREVSRNGSPFGYAVNGTPADCVKIGIKEIATEPVDLVVSGINLGANVGINVIYSGTVSAATEGAIMGVPAMAVSLNTYQEPADYAVAARFARKMARYMVTANPLRHIPLNVNVPALSEEEINGIAVTRQGKARLVECFERRVDPRGNVYYWLAGETQMIGEEETDTDAHALRRGMISVTPIDYDLTRRDALGAMAESLRSALPR